MDVCDTFARTDTSQRIGTKPSAWPMRCIRELDCAVAANAKLKRG